MECRRKKSTLPIILGRLYPSFKFPDQFPHKVPSIKFHVYPSSGSRTDKCGQKGGHDEGDSRFCNYVNAPDKESP